MNDTKNVDVDVSDDDDVPSSSITILPSLNDVIQCQCSSWYPIFSNLQLLTKKQQEYMKGRYKNNTNNVTIKSYIIKPLPQEFIDYLLSNEQQFILPNNTRTSSILLEARNDNNCNNPNDIWSSDDENENDDDVEDDDNENEDNTATKTKLDTTPNQSAFDELNQQIKFGIQSLYTNKSNHNNNTNSNDCCIIPKLNWSSPKDATWINNGTMKCYCSGDIYLLFKASDFITYDLIYAIHDVVIDTTNTTTTLLHTTNTDVNSDTTDTPHELQQQQSISSSSSEFSYELVLRKYCNLYPSQEFRCFISNNHIIGISQRYIGQEFIFLQSMKEQYKQYIYEFYMNIIIPNIQNKMIQYVVDLYIDQKHRIWIIDFNVWGTRTDALLFHWSELIQKAKYIQEIYNDNIDYLDDDDCWTNIEIRIVESIVDQNKNKEQQQMIYPNPLSNYKAPLDALFLNASNQINNTKCNNNNNNTMETTMEPSSVNTTTTTFDDFMKLCVRPSTIVDSDSDTEDSNG